MSEAAESFVPKVTYGDYLELNDDKRWEIFDGHIDMMSPSPSWDHQGASHNLAVVLGNQLRGQKCKVRSAPLDVIFPKEDESEFDTTNMVQPDLVVVCDPKQITKRGVVGPPSLVVEVLSPSTAKNDRLVKSEIYARFGVPEYWIVDLEAQAIEVYLLERPGVWRMPAIYKPGAVIEATAAPGLRVPVAEVFEE